MSLIVVASAAAMISMQPIRPIASSDTNIGGMSKIRIDGSCLTSIWSSAVAIRSSKPDEARSYLDGELAKRPKNPDLRLLSGGLHTLMGNMVLANNLTSLITIHPEDARRQLTRALELASDSKRPQSETARAALAALPSAPAP